MYGIAARLPAVVGNGCEAAGCCWEGCEAAVLLLGMTGRLLAVVGYSCEAASCCWELLRGCGLGWVDF